MSNFIDYYKKVQKRIIINKNGKLSYWPINKKLKNIKMS